MINREASEKPTWGCTSPSDPRATRYVPEVLGYELSVPPVTGPAAGAHGVVPVRTISV